MTKEHKFFKVMIEDKEHDLYFKHPNQEELFEMDLIQRKFWSLALKNEVPTEIEVKDRLQKSGAWTTEKDKRLNELAMEIAQKEAVLRVCEGSEDEKFDIVTDLTELRTEMISLAGLRTELFKQSAEGLANDQRIHKFIELCCMIKGDKEKFFIDRDYSEYISQYPDAMSLIVTQGTIFQYNVPEDVSEEWEEIKYLKNYFKEKEKKLKEEKPKGRKKKKTTKRVAKKKTTRTRVEKALKEAVDKGN